MNHVDGLANNDLSFNLLFMRWYRWRRFIGVTVRDVTIGDDVQISARRSSKYCRANGLLIWLRSTPSTTTVNVFDQKGPDWRDPSHNLLMMAGLY
ncbi:hypothetical protein OH492_09165 [Vibrio chagasii]|nr:hypothetical protein [Vibrio chagasii]